MALLGDMSVSVPKQSIQSLGTEVGLAVSRWRFFQQPLLFVREWVAGQWTNLAVAGIGMRVWNTRLVVKVTTASRSSWLPVIAGIVLLFGRRSYFDEDRRLRRQASKYLLGLRCFSNVFTSFKTRKVKVSSATLFTKGLTLSSSSVNGFTTSHHLNTSTTQSVSLSLSYCSRVTCVATASSLAKMHIIKYEQKLVFKVTHESTAPSSFRNDISAAPPI